LLLLACTDFNGVKSSKRCAVRILELFVLGVMQKGTRQALKAKLM